MTPEQQQRLDAAPDSVQGILRRAYEGGSRAAGVKAFCLHCVGYNRADVRDCTARGCPLHPYRPYQQGSDE